MVRKERLGYEDAMYLNHCDLTEELIQEMLATYVNEPEGEDREDYRKGFMLGAEQNPKVNHIGFIDKKR